MSGKDARFYFKKVILCNYKKNLKAMNLFRLLFKPNLDYFILDLFFQLT